MQKEKHSFTEGPLFFKITAFALPIILTGILQILYNMADNIVVGSFSGDNTAVAAVGSTSSLNHLILNLLLGMSAGAGIAVAQSFGAKDERAVRETVHTSMLLSVIAGVAIAIIGFIFAPYALKLMRINPEIIDKSALYIRIICLGIPASSVYNFGASILRSVGDSKTPLIILSSTGLLNVVLNLLFVIVFHMTVDGVAYATIASQYLSAVVIVIILIKRKSECYALMPDRLKLHRASLNKILRIGIPAGLQGSMFSLANVFIMSAVNSFSLAVISAYTIATSIEGITFTCMDSFQQAAMTFTGQNFGAGNRDRVKKVLLFSVIQVTVAGVLVGQGELLLGRQLAGLFIDAADPAREEVIHHAMQIMRLFLNTYFICGIMSVLSGAVKGLGASISPMILSLLGVCVLRLWWIYAIFFPSEKMSSITEMLFCFPLSWVATAFALLTALMLLWRKHGMFAKKYTLNVND